MGFEASGDRTYLNSSLDLLYLNIAWFYAQRSECKASALEEEGSSGLNSKNEAKEKFWIRNAYRAASRRESLIVRLWKNQHVCDSNVIVRMGRVSMDKIPQINN